MRTLIVLALVTASSVTGAPRAMQDGAGQAGQRAALLRAHARLYSAVEILMGTATAYSVACKDEKAFTTLMMLDMMMSRALSAKKAVARDLAAAAAVSSPDPSAHELALAVMEELTALSAAVDKVMEPARTCAAFMTAKDNAANLASRSDDGDMTWSAARSHAAINIRRLAEFESASERAAARGLVERTKPR
ncbi:MAG TPA: hypothetical protein VMN81_13695 [Vicinamibacterales bacterium]|nr:hypothetical protein [Vicinamibacterales bacterium]